MNNNERETKDLSLFDQIEPVTPESKKESKDSSFYAKKDAPKKKK